MVTPDKKKYDSFLINNDYIGLANYLDQFNIADKNKRIQVKQDINKLKRYGSIANAILEKQIDEADKSAIIFSMQRDHGVYDTNNTYTKQYLDAVNSIGNKTHWFKDDETAEIFQYVFDTKNEYDKFIEESGLTIKGYDDKNPTAPYMFMYNGQPVIQVRRDAFKNTTFFDSLNKGLETLYASDYDKAMWRLEVMHNPQAEKPTNGFRTISYDKSGKKLQNVEGFDEYQKKAWDYAKESNNAYKKNIEEAYEKVVPTKLMTSGFLCGAQRNLYTMAMNGQIDASTFNMQSNIIKDYYDNALYHTSLTGCDEVYMTHPDNDSQTLDVMRDEDKGKWTEIMRTALKEGRVKYGAGSAGGRVGTVITIIDKTDKNDDASDGDYGKGTQIFVPGLFDEDARDLIDSDPDAKLQVDLAEHQAFGHDYTLIEGGVLSDFDGDGGATYKDDVSTYYLTPEEVQQRMRRNILIQGGIDEAKNVLEFDNAGYLQPASTDLLDQILKYSTNVYSIDSNAQTKEELETDEAKQEIDNIYMLILRELGLDREGNILVQ